MLGGAYLECLDGSLMLLLQLLQLVLLLLLQVSQCMAMLPLHAGHSGSMLLLCCPQLGLQALSLGLAVFDLMPVMSKHSQQQQNSCLTDFYDCCLQLQLQLLLTATSC